MAARLLLAPAGRGKTQAVLERIARLQGEDRLCGVWVCLPHGEEIQAFRRRLAQQGGSLGVTLGTFHELYGDILRAARRPFAQAPEPVRLALVEELLGAPQVRFFRSVRHKPGLHRRVLGLIDELKQDLIPPQELAREVRGRGSHLEELAQLYVGYQARLTELGLADAQGLGWLALEALEADEGLFSHLRFLAVDGFDRWGRMQLAVLRLLAARLPDVWLTLTGEEHGRPGEAHRRFSRTRAAVERTLGVRGEGLPGGPVGGSLLPADLVALEAALFGGGPPGTAATGGPGAEQQADRTHPRPPWGGGGLSFLEAASPLQEARQALRWLKGHLLEGPGGPSGPEDCAVLARELAPYRAHLLQTAREFGLPVQLVSGEPLSRNPLVAVLLELVALPVELPGRPPFARRPLLDLWRSPYLHLEPLGISAGDARLLAAAARWGQVQGGLEQWRETLRRLGHRSQRPEEDEEARGTDRTPRGEQADRLGLKLEAFVRLIQPPGGDLRSWVGWLEALIGPDPALGPEGRGRSAAPGGSLQVVARVWVEADEDGPAGWPLVAAELVERDVEALRAFKDVLRGLVLAEEVGGRRTEDYTEFLRRLTLAVAQARYHPAERRAGAVLLGEVEHLRGARFGAVAILGLSEGSFPAPEPEDPLLRDEDREELARSLPLEPRHPDEEPSRFYQAVTRADRALLLSRPYLTAEGEAWEPSAYWAAARRAVPHAPLLRTGQGQLPAPHEAASWAEALARLARDGHSLPPGHPREDDWRVLQAGREVLSARLAARAAGPYEGQTCGLVHHLRRRFVGQAPWSASRLESYIACPHQFFVRYALELEPRGPVGMGFDVAQLGRIFHALLEETYRQPGDPQQGLAQACARLLPEAPERFGFRRSQLWEVQRREIERVLQASLAALEEHTRGDGGLRSRMLEVSFGFPELPESQPALELDGPAGERIRLRGVVDRVDCGVEGEVRIIDYKLGASPSSREVRRREKIQLGIYALAAERVLGLPPVREAFYWHVRPARSTPIPTSPADLEGVEARVREVVSGVLAEEFAPRPPPGGCPPWCPAAVYCWRYSPPPWAR